jgi:hypothetical protein
MIRSMSSCCWSRRPRRSFRAARRIKRRSKPQSREEMKTKLNVNIASIDLKKQSDGGYIGTATADNGDVYDVTVTPPQGSRIEWKAFASQATLEKDFRTQIENWEKLKVKTLNLIKQEAANYTGMAVFENDAELGLEAAMEGTQFKMTWKYAKK